MPRSTASIQAQINSLETFIQGGGGIYTQVSADGTSATRMTLDQATTQLNKLYLMLDRMNGNAPMIVRGSISGLR